jgi:5,10-methylene-tetrahydrofolate dehydrogenase/methenyl tetrahydrofolate cyclohydrolase
VYARLKGEAAERVGVGFERIDVSVGDDLEALKARVLQVGERSDVQGVMIQKPNKRVWVGIIEELRSRIKSGMTREIESFQGWWRELADTIAPEKDVDGLTSATLEKINKGDLRLLPATVKAIVTIIDMATIDLQGHTATVLGRSDIVGKPLAAALEHRGMKVHLLGSKDEIKQYTLQSDVVVSATGVAGLVKFEHIKPGAIVIDVGSPRAEVDFEGVKEIASFITPVPNGVGPMTVVSLLENLVDSCISGV